MTTIRLRRGPAQRWLQVDPVLAEGEPGYDTTSGELRVGDGLSTWSDLPTFEPRSTARTPVLALRDTSGEQASRVLHLNDFGARFDRREARVSTTANSTTLTSSDAIFDPSDLGRIIVIRGAGSPSGPTYGTYIGNIASVVSETQATLSQPAAAAVRGATAAIGTNNDPAWRAAFEQLRAIGGGTLLLPAGGGMHATQKTPPSDTRIVGAGRDLTVIHPVGSVDGFNYRLSAGPDEPLSNFHLSDLTIDGDLQTNGDGAGAKGTGLYYISGCTFVDVSVRNAAGSGFGNDFQRDCWYVRCIAEGNGRIGTSDSPGHSGFGFGSGGWEVENVYLLNCLARGNRRHGCFFEWQPDTGDSTTATNVIQSRGAQIIGGRFEGNGLTGISDQATGGLVVLGTHIADNGGDGFAVSTTSALDNIAVDGTIADCVISGNGGNGVRLEWVQDRLPVLGRYRVLDNLIVGNSGQGLELRADESYVIPDVEIRGNAVFDNLEAGLRVERGTFRRLRVVLNNLTGNGAGRDGRGAGLDEGARAGILILGELEDAELSMNKCSDPGRSRQAIGLSIDRSGGVRGASRITSNDFAGNAVDAVRGLDRVGGEAVVSDNGGLGPGEWFAVPTAGARQQTRRCGVRPEQHVIAGGTITGVSINGTRLLPEGGRVDSFTADLRPSDALVVAYVKKRPPVWNGRQV